MLRILTTSDIKKKLGRLGRSEIMGRYVYMMELHNGTPHDKYNLVRKKYIHNSKLTVN